MSNNKTPVLLSAAIKALMALRDHSISKKIEKYGNFTKEDVVHVLSRNTETGKDINERMREAHDELQSAIKLFLDDEGNLPNGFER